MQIQVQQIQQIVSNVTKISLEDIISQTRKANIVQARHLSMHFSRWYTALPMKKIANLHGKDNHATIIHADEVISSEIRRNKSLKAIYEEIESQIKNF